MTLTGTPAHPTLVNTSGKSLTGYVLHFEDALGGGDYRRNLNTHQCAPLGLLDIGIPPGGTKTLDYPTPPIVSVAPGGVTLAPRVTVRVVLDALIFPDGQFVGPDQGDSFEVLVKQLVVEQELARRVSAARNDPAKRAAILAEVTGLD